MTKTTTYHTRRQAVIAAGSALSLGLAGCASGDNGTSDDSSDGESTEATVQLLAVNIGDKSTVTTPVLDEACESLTSEDASIVIAAPSTEEAPTITAPSLGDASNTTSNTQPYSVSLDNPTEYFIYDLSSTDQNEADQNSKFAFFVEGGTITTTNGRTLDTVDDVSSCSSIGTYIIVEPTDNTIILELSPP